MKSFSTCAAAAALLLAPAAWAAPVFTTFEAAGVNAAAITPIRDAFRTAIGGGTVASANGSFGGVRREIDWDGVPDARFDPNDMPANFFNVNSPRGVVFSTPGTGFLVSANASGTTPSLFGFASDFQAFCAKRIFTAANSNITDVRFFAPGTSQAPTTSAFGLIFVDVELNNLTGMELFDENDVSIDSHAALVGGNQGLSFLGATATEGQIGRVRIKSGRNTIVANGQLGNPFEDVVLMHDFIYAEPRRAIPEPSAQGLVGLALFCGLLAMPRREPGC